MAAMEHFLNYVKRRELPVTEPLSLDTPETVEGALEALREHGVVSRFAGGPEVVYSIEPDQHLAAAYYRNTIIHFFVAGAIAEAALLAVSDRRGDPVDGFWEEVMALRDLLKFEFFFPEKEEFREQVREEIDYHRPGWEQALRSGEIEVLDLVRAFDPYRTHWVLRPFLEAYRVVADALEAREPGAEIAEKPLLDDCMALGKQYRLQHRIRSPESVSTVLFRTALRLARNRGLLEGRGAGVAEARAGFAAEIRATIRCVDGIEALAAARQAGLAD
jgi:glycerol-3-phosphate O-acyltransferase